VLKALRTAASMRDAISSSLRSSRGALDGMTDSKKGEAYVLGKEYRDPKHWDRGAKGKIGAPSDKLIHIAVGHALTNWEHVELAASMLFSHFVDSHSIAAERAYGTIQGGQAKQHALTAALESYCDLGKIRLRRERDRYDAFKSFETIAKVLIRNYGLASGRRNDIAHGIAWELSTSNSSSNSWFLAAPTYNSKRTQNWINDDFKLRGSTGMRLSDPVARFAYNKIYYKNSEYIFGLEEIKVFAGKFAYLRAEMLALAHVANPQKFTFAPSELRSLAAIMSK
jgi:hypothetical protein